jgi:hypothetical protein
VARRVQTHGQEGLPEIGLARREWKLRKEPEPLAKGSVIARQVQALLCGLTYRASDRGRIGAACD